MSGSTQSLATLKERFSLLFSLLFPSQCWSLAPSTRSIWIHWVRIRSYNRATACYNSPDDLMRECENEKNLRGIADVRLRW